MTITSDSLELAVKLEEEGYEYYKQAAAETDNKLSKSVLESLAQQELDHKETFQEIAEGKGIISEDVQHENIETEIKEVFENLSDKEQEAWKEEEVEVYEQAMEMEKKIYNLYQEMVKESDDETEIEFLKALMEEENKHQESLQNVLYYMTQNEYWLADEESKVWNWMNI